MTIAGYVVAAGPALHGIWCGLPPDLLKYWINFWESTHTLLFLTGGSQLVYECLSCSAAIAKVTSPNLAQKSADCLIA